MHLANSHSLWGLDLCYFLLGMFMWTPNLLFCGFFQKYRLLVFIYIKEVPRNSRHGPMLSLVRYYPNIMTLHLSSSPWSKQKRRKNRHIWSIRKQHLCMTKVYCKSCWVWLIKDCERNFEWNIGVKHKNGVRTGCWAFPQSPLQPHAWSPCFSRSRVNAPLDAFAGHLHGNGCSCKSDSMFPSIFCG